MAMRMNNINMTTEVDKVKLLETLEKNLETHSKIVQEAKDGYLKKASEVLAEKIEQIKEGKIVALAFSLKPPVDYSEVYENSIEMLKWHKGETVTLEADEFRQLVRDEWDWTDNFLLSNSNYSGGANVRAISKNLL